MKSLNHFIPAALFLLSAGACDHPTKQPANNPSTKESKDSPLTKTVLPDSTFTYHIVTHDSSKIEVEVQIELPKKEGMKWLSDTLARRVDFSTNGQTRVTLSNLEKVNDSVSFIIYSQADGVGSESYLMTLKWNKPFDIEKIGEDYDADFSFPGYNSIEYKALGKSKFLVTNIDTDVADSSVLDSTYHFKDGYSMENVKLKEVSTFTWVQVNPDGKISRVKQKNKKEVIKKPVN